MTYFTSQLGTNCSKWVTRWKTGILQLDFPRLQKATRIIISSRVAQPTNLVFLYVLVVDITHGEGKMYPHWWLQGSRRISQFCCFSVISDSDSGHGKRRWREKKLPGESQIFLLIKPKCSLYISFWFRLKIVTPFLNDFNRLINISSLAVNISHWKFTRIYTDKIEEFCLFLWS